MHGHGTFKPYCLTLPIIHSQSPTLVSYEMQDHLKLMGTGAKLLNAAMAPSLKDAPKTNSSS